MGQRFHPEIYRQADRNCAADRAKTARVGNTVFNSVLTRLRHVHVPILLAVLRFRGKDASTAEILMQPIFMRLGFCERLPNGDIAIMCIVHSRKIPTGGGNSAARISRILSRRMQRLSRCGVDASCLIAFARLWSDECQNEADILSLTRLRGDSLIEIR
jgi:hypothetical protein